MVRPRGRMRALAALGLLAVAAALSVSGGTAARKLHFGSAPKVSGHENELRIADSLNRDAAFRSNFCARVGRAADAFVAAGAGGRNAGKEEGVLGCRTTGKTDVSVRWKDGTRTNVSIKKAPAGQVYLVTARNFADTYEAQFGARVPPRVRKALALFIGEDEEAKSILEATPLSVDGEKSRAIARRQNGRLMFSVLRHHDPAMAAELLAFLRDNMENVVELCFAAGAVRDRRQWSDVLWYRNLVDPGRADLDWLVPIPSVKAAVRGKSASLEVVPGPGNGSTIQLPFGHLQYHLGQLEFYQKLPKLKSLLSSRCDLR